MSTSTLSPELTGQYQFDTAHSRLGFVARHAMVTKVYGAFNEWEGSAYLDAADPSKSHAKVTVQVASVDTRNEQRDGHLRTNDFFDAPAFPLITFTSTAVEQVGATEFRVTGDLTIKDVTRSITIDFEYTGSAKDAFGAERAGLEGRTVVNRKDYGINFNAVLEAGGVMVSEKITLEFDISAVKVTPAA